MLPARRWMDERTDRWTKMPSIQQRRRRRKMWMNWEEGNRCENRNRRERERERERRNRNKNKNIIRKTCNKQLGLLLHSFTAVTFTHIYIHLAEVVAINGGAFNAPQIKSKKKWNDFVSEFAAIAVSVSIGWLVLWWHLSCQRNTDICKFPKIAFRTRIKLSSCVIR